MPFNHFSINLNQNIITVEQLFKPRFEAIADYPNSLFKVGLVINTGYDRIFCDSNSEKYSDFPHLFKKLEWYEKRNIADMPKYLKETDLSNCRISYIEVLNWILTEIQIECECDKYNGTIIFYSNNEHRSNKILNFEPISEDEYLSNCNKA